MCRLLRQAHPHLVLLRTLGGEKRKDSNHHKNEDHAELHIRIRGETFEHDRVVIAHKNVVVAHTVVERYAYKLVGSIQTSCHLRGVTQRIGIIVTALDLKVTERLHVAHLVDNDHGDGVVVVNDLQHEVKVGVLVGIVERAHGLTPYLHLAALFSIEVPHKKVGDNKREHSQHDGCHKQHNLYLTNSVCPLHNY